MKKKRFAASLTAAVLAASLPVGMMTAIPSRAASTNEVVFNSFDSRINGGEPIRGVDVSSVIAVEKAGVKFKNDNGEEQDIFKTLSEHGVNYVRVRVWNEPYNSDGKAYGGGNSDVYTAGLIGKRAAEYGMKLLVDIQYSDFWADPGKQTRPKYWQPHDHDTLKGEIYKWTSWVLKSVTEAGGDIGMVQIGNETNCFFCGEKDMYKICDLFASGNKAVRDFNKNILIAHHFANPSTGYFDWYAKVMKECNLDYDVFAASYYPYWHGSLSDMTKVLKDIGDTYNKYVMVAETAYPYTNDDGDTFGNAVSSGSSGCVFNYDISVDGQAKCLSDVFQAVANTGSHGIGVFYWEPAWLGVNGISYDEQKDLWEQYGSGWATKYAYEFDKEATATGGSAYDNQALFDFSGKPLSSLDVFLNVLPQAKQQTMTTSTTSATTTSTTTTTVTSSVTTTTQASDKIYKIMAIGDSITDGYGIDGSYRKFLYNSLTSQGYRINMTGSKDDITASYTNPQTGEAFEYDNGNTGYSGYAIQQYNGRNGIYETLKSTGCLSEDPDIIILQIGTNDIIDNHELDKAGERLKDLISYILENIPESSALFVTTVPDIDPNRSGVYDWFGNYRHSPDWQTQYDDETAEKSVQNAVKQYNSDVQAAVIDIAQRDKRVHFVNVNKAVTNVKTQLEDGVHPNNDGYKAMGEYWADIISKYLKGESIPDEQISINPKRIILGDLNGDDNADIYDLIALRRAVLSKKYSENGDFNCDGLLNVADLVSFQKFLLGKKTD